MIRSAIERMMARLRPDDRGEVHGPDNEEGTFALQFEDLLVGLLRHHAGEWEFRYSDEFRRQSQIQALVDFPDLEKVYRSHMLWPFFMARIPGIAQPQVRETIQEEGIDENSDVQLLRRFGERTISNPFVLRAG